MRRPAGIALASACLATAMLTASGASAAEGCVAATGVNEGHCAYSAIGPGGYLAVADEWSIDAKDFFGDVIAHFGSDVGSDPLGLPGTVPAAYVVEARVIGSGAIVVGSIP